MRRMRRLLVAVLVLAWAAVAVETNQLVTLAWDYPAEEGTNVVFKLYSSPKFVLPLSDWMLLTNVPGTDRQLTLMVQPGERYYYLTASNWWGESDPSNVASTPPVPRSGVLTIRRGK